MIRSESRIRDDSEPHCTIIDVSRESHWPTIDVSSAIDIPSPIDVSPPAGSATSAETGGEWP